MNDDDSGDNRDFLNFFEAYVTMEEQKKKDREDLYNLINEARLLGITVSEREILRCNNDFLKRVILDEIGFQKAKRKERLEKEEEEKRKILKFWQEREIAKIDPERAIKYGYSYNE